MITNQVNFTQQTYRPMSQRKNNVNFGTRFLQLKPPRVGVIKNFELQEMVAGAKEAAKAVRGNLQTAQEILGKALRYMHEEAPKDKRKMRVFLSHVAPESEHIIGIAKKGYYNPFGREVPLSETRLNPFDQEKSMRALADEAARKLGI